MKRVTLLVVLLFAVSVVASKSSGAQRYGYRLAITTTSLPGGTVGVSYSGQITVTGGTAPYKYSASGLPSGLLIGSSTGAITGKPTAAGAVTVGITVTDSSRSTEDYDCSRHRAKHSKRDDNVTSRRYGWLRV